jgi:hypothetical protein
MQYSFKVFLLLLFSVCKQQHKNIQKGVFSCSIKGMLIHDCNIYIKKTKTAF